MGSRLVAECGSQVLKRAAHFVIDVNLVAKVFGGPAKAADGFA
jgi:hypothetical protein